MAIARTLALEPSLLMMDEPFASLDTLTREDLQDLTLSLWRKQPSTMVLVTHNIEEAVYWEAISWSCKRRLTITPGLLKMPVQAWPATVTNRNFAFAAGN